LPIPAGAFYLPAMPELAEVEYFRRRWDAGVGQTILSVELRAEKRIFRGNNIEALRQTLAGAKLTASEARGKQMLFRFSNGGWLGLHLGMTGELRCEPPAFTPGKHDHLALRQRERTLVFADARQFGRVWFHRGRTAPEWWSRLPPALTSPAFTFQRMEKFLARHARPPLKAVLLRQEGFPGIGNWMADEALWRAQLHPRVPAGRVAGRDARRLWRAIRFVCRGALRIVSKDYSDPPPNWLFQHRWKPGGRCPKDKQLLMRATIGGRTTAWCPQCQPGPNRRVK
jgi:formamidopyrimidine-DNA glycosylase